MIDLGKWAFGHSKLVYFLLAVLLVGGLKSAYDMGKLEDPEVKVKIAMVVGVRPGASAHEMELEVTDPLEKAIRTVGEVDNTQSWSYNDLCIIQVELKSTTPDDRLEQCWDMLRHKVSDAEASLPGGTSVTVQDDFSLVTFRISPGSFYQVNPVQTELLYEKAIHEAHLTGKERVIDAYCGTGTIGIIAAKNAGEVIGVELNRDAIRDAVINAKRNDIRNIRFYNDDAGKFMVEMAQKGEKADVVIMDPPRTGSDEAFLSSVVKLSPERVVYVSCGPETLARDLKYLTKHGYRMKRATPYDCFPFTSHIETVCCLTFQGR